MDKTFFSLTELEEASKVSQRNIKYYIQEGLLPPPLGRGKGSRYSLEHLEGLRNILALRKEGYSLARIKELRLKTSETMVVARPQGIAVTRTEVGIFPGVFLSFVHEACPLDKSQRNKIIEKVVEVLNSELTNLKDS